MFGYNKYKDDITVPGTTPLVGNKEDSEDLGLKTNKDEIILFPQPSKDPNDPLNWSRIAKNIHFFILCLFVCINAAGSAWQGTLYDLFAELFQVSYNKLNVGSGLNYLFLAFSCLMSQPLANKFGRRATYLTSTVLAIVSSIVFIAKPTYGGYLGCNIVNGAAIGPIDSLVEVSIADIFFLDQHAKYMGLYVLAIGIGSNIGPFLSGYIAQYLSTWQWCNYILIIALGSLFVLEFFFLEDSLYHRKNVESSEEKLLELAKSNISNETNLNHKNTAIISNIIEQNSQDTSIGGKGEDDLPRKSYIQRLALISTDKENKANWFDLTVAPFYTLRYPAIAWTSFTYGVQIWWLSLLSVSMAEFYAAPPYNFSTNALGNLGLAGIIGSFIGALYMLPLDKYQVFRSSRNNGISEPEFRLELYCIPWLVCTTGLFMYGFGPHFKLNWIVGAIGIVFINVGLAAQTGIALTYVLESYPKQASKSMVAILFVRNIWGLIFNFVFQDWLDNVGVLGTTIMLGLFCFFFNSTFLIFMFWGKNLRKYTEKWYTNALLD